MYESIAAASTSNAGAGGSRKELVLVEVDQAATDTFRYQQPTEYDTINDLIYLSTSDTTHNDPLYITESDGQGKFISFLDTGYIVPIAFQTSYYKASTHNFYSMTTEGIVEVNISVDDFANSSTSATISSYFEDQLYPETGIFSILYVEGDLLYCVKSLEKADIPNEWLVIDKSTGDIISRTNTTYVGNQEFQAPRGYFDPNTNKYYFIHFANETSYWDIGDVEAFFPPPINPTGVFTYRVFDFNTMTETTYSTLDVGVAKEYYLGRIRRIVSETTWELYANIGTTFALLTIDITTGKVVKELVSDKEFPTNTSNFSAYLTTNPIIFFNDVGRGSEIKVIMNQTDFRELALVLK